MNHSECLDKILNEQDDKTMISADFSIENIIKVTNKISIGSVTGPDGVQVKV